MSSESDSQASALAQASKLMNRDFPDEATATRVILKKFGVQKSRAEWDALCSTTSLAELLANISLGRAPARMDEYVRSEMPSNWTYLFDIDEQLSYHDFVEVQEELSLRFPVTDKLTPSRISEDASKSIEQGDDDTSPEGQVMQRAGEESDEAQNRATLLIHPRIVEYDQHSDYTNFHDKFEYKLTFTVLGNPEGGELESLRQQIKRVKHFRIVAKHSIAEWIDPEFWSESKVWSLSTDLSLSPGHADKHLACRIESFLDEEIERDNGSLKEWKDVDWFVKPLTEPCSPESINRQRNLTVWATSVALTHDYRRMPGDTATKIRADDFTSQSMVQITPSSRRRRRGNRNRNRNQGQRHSEPHAGETQAADSQGEASQAEASQAEADSEV
jgi:hypothetical protein